MKYNITLDRVILDLLQQRFPECVFGKAKAARNVSIQYANVGAKLFSLQERSFIVCLHVIVQVAALWPADEQTLHLMG